MEKFVIIDGNNLMFRAFYALPQLTNFQGEISNGVFGFANMLIKVIKDENPKYIAVTFDVSKKNFRHDKFPMYKGTRKPTPNELISQFPIVKDMLHKMNIKVVEKEGLEADDLMGCLSKMFDVQNIILSADRDTFQLIGDKTSVMFPKKGITETILVNKDNLKDLYGVNPSQVIDLKSLMGDSSDNIPGVSGIGEKTAISLIDKYDNLDNVYNHIDEMKGKLKENLIKDKEVAYLSKYLATIVTDLKLDYSIDNFIYDFPFNNDVYDLFKRYQFNSLLKREDLFVENNTMSSKINVDIIKVNNNNLNDVIKDIESSEEISSYIKDDNLYINNGKTEYLFSFALDMFSDNLSIKNVMESLRNVFESNSIKKILFNSKDFKHILEKYKISINNVSFDLCIARYLINSIAKPEVSLNDIMIECSVDTNAFGYAIFEIKKQYYAMLEKMDLLSLFYDIELPLVDVLFNMENEGFKIDIKELDILKNRYFNEIKELETKIYFYADEEFNISSPKQLAVILFDKLHLNINSNKKRSTSIDVLNEIEFRHPIIPLIIKYRTITKLYNTYIMGFKDLIGSDNKIHSVFNQTITATGRLSSSEPNLQNIPVRSDEGRLLRRMFIPSYTEGFILSADYSQIELRLLASFSLDDILIDAYSKGQDIHARTASEVFGVPIENVTSDLRRNAKEINFGIIYGMSEFGLSQSIGSTRKQAKEYMDLYFKRYPKIQEYMNSNIESCKENGYIKTMFGRVRQIPEINSSNFNIRSFGQRAAMNMPLQGSASDIIKLAMVKVFNELKNKKLKSKLILQVHDELLIDVYPGELEMVQNLVKNIMENIVDLKVKLLVNISSGQTWYDAK